MSLSVDRIERFEDGEILHIAIDAEAEWARSDFPDPLLIVDYDASGRVIGIEAVGALARAGLKALLDVLPNHMTEKPWLYWHFPTWRVRYRPFDWEVD